MPVVIVLNVINILFHSTGCCLLVTIYKRDRKSNQQLLLINISATKVLFSVNGLIICISKMFTKEIDHLEYVYLYALLVTSSFIIYVYYISMGLITIDRLLSVMLHFRYKVLCTKGRLKCALLTTWITCFIFFVITTIIVNFLLQDYKNINDFLEDSYTIKIIIGVMCRLCELIILVIIVISYTLIFIRYISSRRQFHQNHQQNSLIGLFKGSKFITPLLLVLSFVFLWEIPNLLLYYFKLTKTSTSRGLEYYVAMSSYLSMFVDGVIYVFLQSRVRALLLQTLMCKKNNERLGAYGTYSSELPRNVEVGV